VVPVLLGGWWRSRRGALGWCSPLSPRRCPTAGCAGLQQPEVEQVAAAFTESGAVDRCVLLAPATVAALEHDESAPCADALGQLDLPGGQVVSSAVWGENAQVRLTGDTLFLTRTAAGWKVAAAGCTPQGEAPYLCRLEA
jgi:hypothetical protein